MQTRIADLTHVGTLGLGRMYAAFFELMRGEPARAAPDAFELARLAREHDLPMWRAFGVLLEGCAAAASGAVDRGLEDMRRGAELLREQNVLWFDELLKIALAEAEARAGDLDRAITILDETLATSDRAGFRAFEAELHRTRGEMLLKRDAANSAPAEDAFLTAIAVAKQQTACSFELRAALSLTKLYQSTGRPAEAYALLAPALDGFSPTSEMPEIAEARTLLSALSKNDGVKAEAARRQRLTQLHAARGLALFAARGGGAPETTTAFARAREQAFGAAATSERFVADFGLWVGSYVRGELPSMRAHAAAFLNDVAAKPESPEAGVAHRTAGITCWFAGEYRQARDHLERALALFQPGRDDELTFRFGLDPGIATMVNLANASWPLGEVDRAISLIDRAQLRSADFTHAGVLAFARMHSALFDLMRRDHVRAAPRAFELAQLAREHGLTMYGAFGAFLEGWASAAGGAPGGGGLADMRRAVDELREQNVLLFDGLLKLALAEAEARAGDLDRAITILEEALATCDRIGYRAFEAELHRTRGEMLLKRDAANSAPAEYAFLTAIAVAKQQATRTFGLRAALALAKLYRSIARPAEAHAILAPALEGFSSTPEMPEIAEAETLLAALGETDDVKAAIAERQRRFDLQTSYSQALLWAKGFASEETMAAFARAGEFAGPAENAAARFGTYDAQCLRSFMRGEYRQAREIAETFVREAEAGGRGAEAGASRRMLGLICLYQGDLKAAKATLERASSDFVPERNKEMKFGGPAGDVTAAAFLALTEWHLGEVERARQHIQQAIRRADELADVPTVATALFFRTILESRRDDVCATRFAAEALLKLSEEYGMKTYSDEGHVYANWARGRVLDPGVGANAAMQALTAYLAPGNKADAPSLHGSLAELEAITGEPAAALAQIDRGLAIAEETGEHFTDAYLHRLRGEILLKRDPTDPAPAEDAYRTAIAIAKKQAARGYELLASLGLAKLYQSTRRSAEAQAVLAPALEGFSPTPEMPVIAEARALLVAIEADAHVRRE
ncbi:MAG TPA: hypothetical protein VFE60_16830 [Roseiarcus sp.]|nr:hypothetical protein [Roseiarcus sp.]